MSTTFTIKQNDTLPAIVETLSSDVGPINLASATEVRFHLKKGSTLKVNQPATVVDASAGQVQYDWADGDTDTVGEYLREWQITFPGGVLTVPNEKDGYKVKIVRELA